MQRMSKFATAAVAAFAALTLGTGASFAEPRDHGDRDNRGDREVRVEKSEAPRQEPREIRRGDRDVNVDVRSDRRRDVTVDVRSDRRRSDGNWRGAGYRDRIVRGHRYSWGPGIAFYFSDGYYYGECGWLKRRAIATGNPIWWRRFHQCRDFS